MVAVAAFLIILVILFGLENVRNFFFGTLGVLAWVLIGVLGLAVLGWLIGGWDKNVGKTPAKNTADERAKLNAQLEAERKLKQTEAYKKESKRLNRLIAIVSIGALLLSVAIAAIISLINK